MSAICFGTDRAGRSQERPANGGAAGAGRLRSIAGHPLLVPRVRRYHFIDDGVWDAAPLEAELLVQADRLVGGKDAVLVIDDTSMPKKGDSLRWRSSAICINSR